MDFMSFLPLLLFILLVIPPVAKILRRAGYSQWLALLVFVPIVNLTLLWVFAYARWPSSERG
jgi:hypothetical protein